MKTYQDTDGWWIEPETEVDRMTLSSLSGPWRTEEAAMLASYGKFDAAHDAEARAGRRERNHAL